VFAVTDVVQKLWGFCHTLRHDGIDYGDYLEQLTYLLFIKMADERGVSLPKGCDWRTLDSKAGTDISEHYMDVLRTLSKEPGLLGDIFTDAQSRFTNPVNLKRLVGLIDETDWTSLNIDVKAEAFEGLLEKAASEGKKGAGQYFTPRIIIESIVRCMKPDPRASKEFTIIDPACGTGGFLVCAYEWLVDEMKGGAFDRKLWDRVRRHVLRPGPGTASEAARADEPLPAPVGAGDRVWRLDLSGVQWHATRCRADEPAVRHERREPGAGAGRLRRLDEQQAAQLHPARDDNAEAGWPCGGGGA